MLSVCSCVSVLTLSLLGDTEEAAPTIEQKEEASKVKSPMEGGDSEGNKDEGDVSQPSGGVVEGSQDSETVQTPTDGGNKDEPNTVVDEGSKGTEDEAMDIPEGKLLSL